MAGDVHFDQTEDLTEDGIAVHPYGAIIIPIAKAETEITVQATVKGTVYTAGSAITAASDVGDTITLSKE